MIQVHDQKWTYNTLVHFSQHVVQHFFIIVFVLVCHISAALAQSDIEQDRGSIVLDGAEFLTTPTGWELRANADVRLSVQMRRGLDSGVPLQFIADVRIKQARSFLPDKTLIAHQERYSLIYYELTRHYRLQTVGSGKSRNFRSLLSALEALGQLNGIWLPRPSHFLYASGQSAHLSLRLDDKALPLPLQPLFSSRWKLASEDFAWSLN